MLQCFCSTCAAIWSAPGLSNRMHIGPHLQCYWSVFLPFVLWNWREGRPCGRDGCALVQPDESSESNKPVERWAWWRHHVENERLRSRAVWKKAREQEPAPSEHTCQWGLRWGWEVVCEETNIFFPSTFHLFSSLPNSFHLPTSSLKQPVHSYVCQDMQEDYFSQRPSEQRQNRGVSQLSPHFCLYCMFSAPPTRYWYLRQAFRRLLLAPSQSGPPPPPAA